MPAPAARDASIGSVTSVVDSSGNPQDTYTYDPYGNTTSALSQVHVPNQYGYIGAVWDSGTKTYKMGERYYDPSVGRFTQLDPLGGGYAYSDGDPINMSDPTGLCPVCLAAPIVFIPVVGEAAAATLLVVSVGVAVVQVYHFATKKSRPTNNREQNKYTN